MIITERPHYLYQLFPQKGSFAHSGMDNWHYSVHPLYSTVIFQELPNVLIWAVAVGDRCASVLPWSSCQGSLRVLVLLWPKEEKGHTVAWHLATWARSLVLTSSVLLPSMASVLPLAAAGSSKGPQLGEQSPSLIHFIRIKTKLMTYSGGSIIAHP